MQALNIVYMTFINAKQAFEEAIKDGRLSKDPKASNYAGYYMYMGTNDNGRHLFKHYDTRIYLP
jgi:hypothetical protein